MILISYAKESLRSQVESELKMARHKITDITKKIESRTSSAPFAVPMSLTGSADTTKELRKNGVAVENGKRKFNGQPLQGIVRHRDENDERGAYIMSRDDDRLLTWRRGLSICSAPGHQLHQGPAQALRCIFIVPASFALVFVCS